MPKCCLMVGKWVRRSYAMIEAIVNVLYEQLSGKSPQMLVECYQCRKCTCITKRTTNCISSSNMQEMHINQF